jgi:hypothetical protein
MPWSCWSEGERKQNVYQHSAENHWLLEHTRAVNYVLPFIFMLLLLLLVLLVLFLDVGFQTAGSCCPADLNASGSSNCAAAAAAAAAAFPACSSAGLHLAGCCC